MGVTGYDNHTKKYMATWMDSMGTGIYFFEGSGPAIMGRPSRWHGQERSGDEDDGDSL
ncbi:MAG: DUF1579 family protein [Nitrospirales bacterium]